VLKPNSSGTEPCINRPENNITKAAQQHVSRWLSTVCTVLEWLLSWLEVHLPRCTR